MAHEPGRRLQVNEFQWACLACDVSTLLGAVQFSAPHSRRPTTDRVQQSRVAAAREPLNRSRLKQSLSSNYHYDDGDGRTRDTLHHSHTA
jgi:hypothetical protein